MIDVSLIKAFIESTKGVFDTMVNAPVKFGRPEQPTSPISDADISGVIGMAGDVTGMVILSFSFPVAEAIIESFCGMKLPTDGEDFADAIGELANIISGGAKAKFEGRNVSISCPTVVRGPKHSIQQPSDAKCISIPCITSAGMFHVRVVIKEVATAKGVRSAAA